MNSVPIIVLEGLPGSGKTTISHRLTDLGYNRIGEVINPMHLEQSENLLGKDLGYFLESDSRKYKLALEWHSSSPTGHILDRGILSTLSYCFAQLYQGIITPYKNSLQYYYANASIFEAPTATIFLDINPKLPNMRKNRLNGSEFWATHENLVQTRQFYLHWFGLHPHQPIYIVDADREQNQVFDSVLSIIKGV